MANPIKSGAPAPVEPPKIKVRVLVEVLGSWREPQAKRGDVIEITCAEFDNASPGTFEDVEAVDRAKAEAAAPKRDLLFEQQREALRAEREASMRARAIQARREAEKVQELAKAAEKEADKETDRRARAGIREEAITRPPARD